MSKVKSRPSATEPAVAPASGDGPSAAGTAAVLRRHAEDQFAEELAALAQVDNRPRPPRWKLSPWAVATYLLGGTLDDGFVDHAQVHRQPPP